VTDACDAAVGRCITCSDEGTPMRVLALGDDAAHCIDEQGNRHQVAVDLVGPVAVGDELLVHAGVAIRHMSAAT
jgi:hydrogenase assembly chaperone HypC/HupF